MTLYLGDHTVHIMPFRLAGLPCQKEVVVRSRGHKTKVPRRSEHWRVRVEELAGGHATTVRRLASSKRSLHDFLQHIENQ